MTFHQEYQGWSPYRPEVYIDHHRVFVGVPCIVGSSADAVYGMLDTAAEWCVLPADLALRLGLEDLEAGALRLETRLGSFWGRLERMPLLFTEEEGVPLTVEATWFVSADWHGPVVLGWKGCLERFRFALDPREERFYFGAW